MSKTDFVLLRTRVEAGEAQLRANLQKMRDEAEVAVSAGNAAHARTRARR